jgi:hypothetical protein
VGASRIIPLSKASMSEKGISVLNKMNKTGKASKIDINFLFPERAGHASRKGKISAGWSRKEGTGKFPNT